MHIQKIFISCGLYCMKEERGLYAPVAPAYFSINSSVSLKTGEKVIEGIIIVGCENAKKHLRFFKIFAHTRTWRGGIEGLEKKLSCVQNREGQRLMAANIFPEITGTNIF